MSVEFHAPGVRRTSQPGAVKIASQQNTRNSYFEASDPPAARSFSGLFLEATPFFCEIDQTGARAGPLMAISLRADVAIHFSKGFNYVCDWKRRLHRLGDN